MATTSSATLARITAYYKTLLEGQPGADHLSFEAQRVDDGQTSTAKILLDLYNSGDRQAGHANEWAEAFFIISGRAPDPIIFNQGMNLLRSGTTFAALMETILAIPGHRLSATGITDNKTFVSTLYSLLTNGGTLGEEDRNSFATSLDHGEYTRGQLLAAALASPDLLLHSGREALVQRSLIYLAIVGKGAGSADLLNADGKLETDILYALDAAGLSTPAGAPYLVRPSSSASSLALKGELIGDVVIDLKSMLFSQGGISPLKAHFSFDGGIDTTLVNISLKHFNGVNTVDASKASGKGKLTITGGYTADSYIFLASVAGGTLKGSYGNDILIGEAGADKLVATAGYDTMTGGAGIDTFLFAQRPDYLVGSTFTQVTDFGNGADILDFSLLLGANAPSLAKISPILASTRTATTVLGNGGVTLVENNGVWTDNGKSIPATSTNIVSLFGTVFKNPETASRSVIITADLSTGADVWVINNDTNVTQITTTEVTLIGHLNGDWNLTLNGLLPVVR